MNQDNWNISQNQWDVSIENHICYFCQSRALMEFVSQYWAYDFACPVCGRYRLVGIAGVNNGHQRPPHLCNRQKVSHLLAERYFLREAKSFAFFPLEDNGNLPQNPWPHLEAASIEGLAEIYPNDTEIPQRILQSLAIYKKNRGIPYGEEIKVDLYVNAIFSFQAPSLNTRWAFCETKEAFIRILEALKRCGQIDYRQDKKAVYIDLTPYTVKEKMEQNVTNIHIGTNNGTVAPNAKNSNITNIVNGIDDTKFTELLEAVKASATSLSETERKDLADALTIVQDYKEGRCTEVAFNLAVKALKAINGGVEFAANVVALLGCPFFVK